MNERIKELVHQTDAWCDQNIPANWTDDVDQYLPLWNAKFAELIVQECAKQCTEISLKEDGIATLHPGQQSFASYRAGAIACSNRLKYYFGVK